MDTIILKLIKKQMQNRGITQQMLCQGLCSETAMFRYLNQKQKPDRLTFNAMLQRLGVSPDSIVTLESAEEYAYFQWKMRILRSMNQSEWNKVQELLDIAEEKKALNPVLQKQFIKIVEGMLALELLQDREKAAACFVEAIQMTHKDYVYETEYRFLLMSNQDWCAVLNLLRLEQKTQSRCVVQALQNIIYQLEKYPLDEQEQVKIYPYALYLLAGCYFMEERYSSCEKLCQKAILMLREQCVLGNLPELMEYSIGCKRILQNAAALDKELQQLEAMQYVLQNYPINREWLILPLMENGQEIQLYEKMIVQKRKELGLSQQKLCENICSVRTLRNIEAGKAASGNYILKLLLERLEIPASYWKCDIITMDFYVLDLYRKLKNLVARAEERDIDTYLEELKLHLDQSVLVNRQWLLFYEGLLEYERGNLTKEEYREYIISVLRLSIPQFSMDKIGTYQLNNAEILLLIQLARAYEYEEKFDEAILLLQELRCYFKKQEVAFDYQYQNRILILYNLAAYYAQTEQYEKSARLMTKVIEKQVYAHRTVILPRAMMGVAYAHLQTGFLQEAKEMYYMAALLGELFYLDDVAAVSWSMVEEL